VIQGAKNRLQGMLFSGCRMQATPGGRSIDSSLVLPDKKSQTIARNLAWIAWGSPENSEDQTDDHDGTAEDLINVSRQDRGRLHLCDSSRKIVSLN